MRVRVPLAAALVALVNVGCSFATVGDVPPPAPTSWATSGAPTLNRDGRVVMFSREGPRTPPFENPPQTDVFVRTLPTKHTEMVSVDNTGAEIPGATAPFGLDAAGNRALFSTRSAVVSADTHVGEDLYVRDVSAQATTLVTVDPSGHPFAERQGVTGGTISADGTRVAFGIIDIFDPSVPAHVYVRDLTAGTTTDLGVPDAYFVQMARDGRHFVVYPAQHGSIGGAPIFIDPPGSTYVTRSFCAGVTAKPLSANGRYLAVSDSSDSTCPGVNGVVIWDRVTDTLSPVPTTADRQSILGSDDSARYLTLKTATGSVSQVTVLDRRTGTTRIVSSGPFGEPGNALSLGGSISGDGRRVAFSSIATNVADTTTAAGLIHVYIKDVVVPTLASASPARLPRGSTTNVTFKGSGFTQPTVGFVTDGLVIASVQVIDSHTISATVTVPGNLTSGPHDIWLIQGSSTALCAACITVT